MVNQQDKQLVSVLQDTGTRSQVAPAALTLCLCFYTPSIFEMSFILKQFFSQNSVQGSPPWEASWNRPMQSQPTSSRSVTHISQGSYLWWLGRCRGWKIRGWEISASQGICALPLLPWLWLLRLWMQWVGLPWFQPQSEALASRLQNTTSSLSL